MVTTIDRPSGETRGSLSRSKAIRSRTSKARVPFALAWTSGTAQRARQTIAVVNLIEEAFRGMRSG